MDKKKVKLWHDDIRKPPDSSWMWARTNDQAILILTQYDVEEASLDHDLGLQDLDPDQRDAAVMKGDSPAGNGYDLVKWMCERNHFPSKITIHSWNMWGADRMAKALQEVGCSSVIVKPFSVN